MPRSEGTGISFGGGNFPSSSVMMTVVAKPVCVVRASRQPAIEGVKNERIEFIQYFPIHTIYMNCATRSFIAAVPSQAR